MEKNRIGETRLNNFGSVMVVEKYGGCNDVWVRFEQGNYLVLTRWDDFLKGKIRNPYDKSLYGVGYTGLGEYKISINGKSTIQYAAWRNMLTRCYDESYQEKHTTYIGCSVSEEWHNFQTFARWYDENFYKVGGETMCLDKDILVKGNKIYSSETCVFVPQRINKLFVKRGRIFGKLPLGVSWNKRDEKYFAQCKNTEYKTVRIGDYSTPEEAFLAYKVFKEELIKSVANEFKKQIPSILYEAMMYHKIEITD